MPTPPPQGGQGQSWFVLDFEAAYGEETVPPEETPSRDRGGAEEGFYGPIGQRVRFRAPLSATLARRVEHRSDLETVAVKQFTSRIPVETVAAKNVTLRIDMVRDAAPLYTQSLQEDDELVAILFAAE